MARYSDIRRGGELKYALDNWINHMTDYENRESGIGQGQERGAQATVYVVPFMKDLTLDEVVEVNVTATHLADLRTYITAADGAEVIEAIGSKTPITVTGFRAARVTWFRNANKVKTVATSKVTKLKYLKYAGDRSACPFGRAADSDDQQDAFNAVRAQLKAQAGLAVNRVSLVREKFAA